MENNICDRLQFEGIMADGFGISPRIVMRDKRLSAEAKAIYAYFQSFAGEKTFPTRDVILEELNMSKTRYYKYLNELLECNYVRIEREKTESGWQKRNVYIMVANPQSDRKDRINPVTKNNSTESNKVDIPDSEKEEKDTEEKQEIPTQLQKPKEKIDLSKEYLYDKLKIKKMNDSYPEESEYINLIYKVIVDLLYVEEAKISGMIYNATELKSLIEMFSELNIIDVAETISKYDQKIINIKSFILTCLMNSRYLTEDELQSKKNKLDRKYMRNKEEKTHKEKPVTADHQDQKSKEVSKFIKERENKLKSLYSKRAIATLNKATNLSEINMKIKRLIKEIDDYKLGIYGSNLALSSK